MKETEDLTAREKRRSLFTDRQMWRTPFLSVVVPVYNVADVLTDCIESIYRQTFQDYELLMIDDASTDDSGARAEELAARDVRARVIHLAKNGGLGAARNRGIEESIGRYIAFIDSDDWVKPWYLSVLAEAAKRHQADVVTVGNEKYYPEPDGSWHKEPHMNIVSEESFLTMDKRKRIESLFTFEFPTMAWGQIISRELLIRTGIRFAPILSEDILFTFRLLYAAGTYVMLPLRGYCYRQRATSIMNAASLEKSRQAMASTLQATACVEQALADMEEFRSDPAFCQRIRRELAGGYIRWLWARVSGGLDVQEVLRVADEVFHEQVPEQAGLLSFLLASWVTANSVKKA